VLLVVVPDGIVQRGTGAGPLRDGKQSRLLPRRVGAELPVGLLLGVRVSAALALVDDQIGDSGCVRGDAAPRVRGCDHRVAVVKQGVDDVVPA
jgi:hypothetical protein